MYTSTDIFIIIIILAILCLLAYYVVFYEKDTKDREGKEENDEAKLILTEEIENIEKELNIKLPESYISLVGKDRPEYIDSTSLLDNANDIIESTKLYRNGYENLPNWPENYIYIGDESDACPYMLNSENCEIIYSDKGNITRKPLKIFKTIEEFVAYSNE